MKIFPRGTMTRTGAGIAVVVPLCAMGLTMLGVGECSPEELAAGCEGATQVAEKLAMVVSGLGSVIGGIIAWRGKSRADRNYQ